MTVQRAPRGIRRHVVAVAALVSIVGGAQAWAPATASAEPGAPVGTGMADLSVSVSHLPGAPFTGDLLTITVTASNAGPSPAVGVVAGLSLYFPFRYESEPPTAPAGCKLTQEYSAVLCSMGTIPAGTSTSIQLEVVPFGAGVYQLPVAVASDTPDIDTEDRSVTHAVIVQQGPTQIDLAVGGIYDLVLGRKPSARETRQWSSAWVNSMWDRRHRVPLAIISSSESRRRRVVEAYPRLLGRRASARDVATWSARMAGGLTFERFEAALVGSTEFARRHPGQTATIQAAFGAILGRRASAAELTDWSARVGSGTTVGQLATSLADSTEGRNRVMERRFRQSVGRSPSNFDRFFWFSALYEGSTADVQWAKLLVSDAYVSQFPRVPGGPITVFD